MGKALFALTESGVRFVIVGELVCKPIPLCKPIRHGRVRLLRDEGAYFGKSTTGWSTSV